MEQLFSEANFSSLPPVVITSSLHPSSMALLAADNVSAVLPEYEIQITQSLLFAQLGSP